MKLSMPLMYDGNPRQAADQVVGLEKAGLDVVWVAEAYGFDSPTLMGYLAAKTETDRDRRRHPQRLLPDAGALLARPRPASTTSPAAARSIGLGASGPQVIEGFHGMPYDKPLGRTREVIEIIRMGLRREPLVHDGIVTLPLPADQGLGLGKPLKILTRPERSSDPDLGRRPRRQERRR